MSKPTEQSAPRKRFRHVMRVGWADCDPARIAFTGRIPYWALEAIDAWWEECVGLDWYELNVDRGFGTPFVHMSLNFRSPVTPRHALECEVRLLALGNSSIRHWVAGRQDGVLCFEGEFVSVFVESQTLKSRRPPADLLEILESL
ncbi:MAG: acyl-CoA thioesterase [Paracoccaceae bacterium]|nr:acyl-CoA thioesterase [Paracoccaceae bacterium]